MGTELFEAIQNNYKNLKIRELNSLKVFISKRVSRNEDIVNKIIKYLSWLFGIFTASILLFYFLQLNATPQNKIEINFNTKNDIEKVAYYLEQIEIKDNNKTVVLETKSNKNINWIFPFVYLTIVIGLMGILLVIWKKVYEVNEKLLNIGMIIPLIENDYSENKKKFMEEVSNLMLGVKFTIYSDKEDVRQLKFSWLKKVSLELESEKKNAEGLQALLVKFYPDLYK